ATAGIQRSPDFLTISWILAQFSPKRKEAERRYREFVWEGMEKEGPWEDLTGQIFLGKEGFVERLQDLLGESQDWEEIPRVQRYASRPSLQGLFLPGGEEDRNDRDRRIYDSHVHYGYTLKEIAHHLKIHYTTVSKAAKRAEEEKR
ncbi:MAG: addiction module toxin RelE, partial [candidate division NC10 bacterium]|nr:addiction module toxin RelE [candidate division NC10 bacterium]